MSPAERGPPNTKTTLTGSDWPRKSILQQDLPFANGDHGALGKLLPSVRRTRSPLAHRAPPVGLGLKRRAWRKQDHAHQRRLRQSSAIERPPQPQGHPGPPT